MFDYKTTKKRVEENLKPYFRFKEVPVQEDKYIAFTSEEEGIKDTLVDYLERQKEHLPQVFEQRYRKMKASITDLHAVPINVNEGINVEPKFVLQSKINLMMYLERLRSLTSDVAHAMYVADGKLTYGD
ncbi:Ccl1 [Acrasis kona]|uniref:Ccl1 n=1 Tax=Acrasis kona TaxID=1008807 RepID=A0AAW2Z8Q3_9EUKA